MLSQASRQIWKRTLSLARMKLLYTRITLTRYTTLYFFFAVITCCVLSALQAVTFSDNANAVSMLAPTLEGAPEPGLVIFDDGQLRTCTSLPNQAGTDCKDVLQLGGKTLQVRDTFENFLVSRDYADYVIDGPDFIDDFTKTNQDNPVRLSISYEATCVPALRRLDDVLHDAKREDVVTFIFHIWLFGLAIVTILNESIPHLIVAVLGHVLGSAWAIYRVQSTVSLMNMYRKKLVPNACGGVDLLGNWWEVRIQHAIPIVAVNVITLVAFLYLSLKLFKVYANHSFSRVGASPTINKMYKFVLVFSVCLQLSGFFSLASTAMWIDKTCRGMLKGLAKHSQLYLAAFIVILVLELPWVVIGWICVRKECKVKFGVFCAIGLFLLTTSTLLFFSDLYRFIFLTWPFFATVTVTAYVLVIATTSLGIICRLNFGKGLAHYLQVTDALEGVDFTPVYFSKGFEADPEKGDSKPPEVNASAHLTSFLELPVPTYQRNNNNNNNNQKKKTRGSSVYSEQNGSPIMLSSSPPLVSEMTPPPKRLSKHPSKWPTTLKIPEEMGKDKDQVIPVMPVAPPGIPIRSISRSSSEGENGSDSIAFIARAQTAVEKPPLRLLAGVPLPANPRPTG